jgi:hypothetical protein
LRCANLPLPAEAVTAELNAVSPVLEPNQHEIYYPKITKAKKSLVPAQTVVLKLLPDLVQLKNQ